MRALTQVTRMLLRADPRAFRRGLALSALVLAMGAALLGLSGWFVTAAAAAGVAGVGIGFDFFRPSAGVRALALGRAAARYGERLVTHDATLRALAALRVRLLSGIGCLPYEAQTRLRGARALNRLTADVDALDGLLLRLVLPALAAVLVQLAAAGALWFWVAPRVALLVLAVYLAGGGLVLWLTARAARRPAEAAETALQDLRAQSLDLLNARAELTVVGALSGAIASLTGIVARDGLARAALDRIERRGAATVNVVASLAAAGALALGADLARVGTITPAQAAIGFFAALALAETLGQLRRGMAELGRMQGAAERVTALAPESPPPSIPAPPSPRPGPRLEAHALRYRHDGAMADLFGPLDLSVAAGETVLLTGRSGAGKSTLLAVLAGVLPAGGGQVRLAGHDLTTWPETALRQRLTLVPQRARLLGGTVAQNLALALPEDHPLPPEDAWAALAAVQLAQTIRARGGLEMPLGEGGAGLSGGQSKRLALARALLRRPEVLLLDEPTEGLDPDTATATLAGIRAFLPDSALVIVSHRPLDLHIADRVVPVISPET